MLGSILYILVIDILIFIIILFLLRKVKLKFFMVRGKGRYNDRVSIFVGMSWSSYVLWRV